jgi:SsrA-binding protein
VKSLRAGRLQLAEAYVLLKDGEAWLFGAHVSPLVAASTQTRADATRTRKLLLHRRQIDSLVGAVERQGRTIVPLAMYWKSGAPSSRSAWRAARRNTTSAPTRASATGSGNERAS